VAGKALKLDPKVFDSRHGTVLDSGTTYAYLPEQAFVAFRDAVSLNHNPLQTNKINE
jgi:Xylanase inhibitor C-terminal